MKKGGGGEGCVRTLSGEGGEYGTDNGLKMGR